MTRTLDPTSRHPHEVASGSGGDVPLAHTHVRVEVDARRARRAVVGLWGRLIRRGALLVTVAAAAYMGLEVASYSMAYPDGVSALQFTMFEDNPAIRMMQGAPNALDTAGGFAIWDAGWMVQLIIAVWALLTVTRLLRGEEDVQRSDLVMAGPLRPAFVTGSVLAVVVAAGVLVGVAAAAVLLAVGTGLAGSLLVGASLASVVATFAGVGAVTSQLVAVRRRAAALAAGALGVVYLVRMVGNSTDDRLWIRWFSPLAWMDVLDPYGESDLRVLLPMLVVPVALGAVAVALRVRRDSGSAVLASDGVPKSRMRMLGSPIAFAWRTNRAVLLAWLVGLSAFALVMGALIGTMIDWLEQDEQYQRIMATLGFGDLLSTGGFLSVIGSVAGLAVALQVAWRLGAARAEEESGRLDALLARPMSRVRWLGGHVALATIGAAVLLLALGSALWLGAATSSAGEIEWTDAMAAVLNTVPVIVLVGGLSVLCLGAFPRLTVGVPVALAVVGYVLTILGPALRWPSWLLDLSPWTHLALVPLQDWAATSGLVMTATGVAFAVVGLVAFRRRDVLGG